MSQCWLKHNAALDGLAVLWFGQLLDGRDYKEDCWWTLMTADYLNLNYCIIRVIQHHHVSVYIYIDFCSACFYSIPSTFVKSMDENMFLICSAPPLPAVSSPPLPLCSHFPHRKWFTVKHIPTANPTTHADLSQQPLPFIFPIFSPPFFFCHGETSWLQPFVFFLF